MSPYPENPDSYCDVCDDCDCGTVCMCWGFDRDDDGARYDGLKCPCVATSKSCQIGHPPVDKDGHVL